MGKKYDSCVKQVKSKIRRGEISKTFRCDSKGKPNPRGRKRCKANAHAICSKLRRK